VARALDEVARADRLAPKDPDVQYQRALVLILAGRRDAALTALTRAVENGYSVALLRRDEDLATLRSDGQFQAIVDGGEVPRRH